MKFCQLRSTYHHPFRPAVLLGLILAVTVNEACAQRDPFAKERSKMVREYIESEGIDNRRLLEAMRRVPRHEFVRRNLRRRAHEDQALPIGYQQTISPPFIVAYMTDTIDPQPNDKVLEIGTGSGYQAAVLAEMAKEVYSIEIVEQLGTTAERLLKKLEYKNVKVKVGDGYKGWAEYAPFDKIIVTCSPENVPVPLVEQLREGGKMVVPLGQRYQQVFYLFEKRDGKLEAKKLIPTLFVPMTGAAEQQRRVKPDPLKPKVINGSFESDDNEDGRTDNWHYQRQVKMVAAEDSPEGKRYMQFSNQDFSLPSQMLQGMPLDGKKIGSLYFNAEVKIDRVTAGRQSYEKPALVVMFYDKIRRQVGEGRSRPWLRNSDWETIATTIPVPPTAREAIIRIGLNGAIGTVCVDNVRMLARPRK